METKSHIKAAWLSFALIIFGIVGWFLRVTDVFISLPLALFYIILVINTHYSVRLFASIIDRNHKTNNAIDALLVFLFFLLAFYLHTPIFFVFFTLILFILATIKYTLQIGVIDHPRLLRKKVLIDLLGCMMCALTLGGLLVGFAISAWLFTIIFGIANILLFFVWPLYKI